jgi:hypothetical protein
MSLHMVMEDSSTYQDVINTGEQRGRVQYGRDTLLLLGTDRFGPPPENVAARLNSISDLDQLQQITRRVHAATDWEDLLRGV